MRTTTYGYSMKYFPREHAAFNSMKSAVKRMVRDVPFIDEAWSGRHSTDREPPFFDFMRYMGPAPGGRTVKVRRVDRRLGFHRGNVVWEVTDPGNYVALDLTKPVRLRDDSLPAKVVGNRGGSEPFPVLVEVTLADSNTEIWQYLVSGYDDPRCVEGPLDVVNS